MINTCISAIESAKLFIKENIIAAVRNAKSLKRAVDYQKQKLPMSATSEVFLYLF